MRHFFTIALAAAISAQAMAAGGYVTAVPKGVAVGVSPNGSHVFGYDGTYGEDSQSTWLYNVADKSFSQFTKYSEADLDAGGQVKWINSSGLAVGTLRDKDWVAPDCTDASSAELLQDVPLYSACIWQDGKLIKLDHNRWNNCADFVAQDGTVPSSNNGFVAEKISEDGSTIVGYLKAFTYMLPVRWKRNASGVYESTMLERHTGEFFYLWVGASNDGSRVIMNTSLTDGVSYVWNGDDAPVVFSYQENESEITNPIFTALSPNGRYAIVRCERDGIPSNGVFDFNTNEITWIPNPQGATSGNWFAANIITDRGDGYIVNYDYKLYYFNTELGINIPISSYVEAYGKDFVNEDNFDYAKSLLRGISADGRVLCGNVLESSLEKAGWIIQLPETDPMLFGLTNCEALFSSTDKLLVKWADPILPEGAAVKRYVVKVDGEENTFAEAATGDDGRKRMEIPASLGSHEITLYAVAADKDGKEYESVHQSLSVAISTNTSLYFFEDLDDSEVNEEAMAYQYVHDTFVSVAPTDASSLSFRVDGAEFYNVTPYWYTCGFSNGAWNTYLESRWFDATGEKDFYFTWQERNLPLNYAKDVTNANKFAVEYTLDGENWITLHETRGKENGKKWNVRVVDLSELAGKKFRLRFHAYGLGGNDNACEWRLDYYGIRPASERIDAPEGLMVTSDNEKGVAFAWKNNRGEYEVSYNHNSPMTYNKNVGNEGKPLWVACDYGTDKLKAFEGKYITSVATMLYEPSSTVVQAYHTTVHAVIFDESGKEISRGKLADDAPWYEDGDEVPVMPIHHIILDTPVKIEQGKTYRVAIEISNYDAEMCPIWYFSASDDYIPGVTDLYSDDDLQSWNSISKLYAGVSAELFNEYARCIFNIRPCISDTAESSSLPYDQQQWFYQVFRNGSLLPYGVAFYTQQSVVDTNPAHANYTVQAYCRDGRVSEMSEALDYVPAAVESVTDDAPELFLSMAGDILSVNGDFDSVAIYDASGICVSNSATLFVKGLPHGLYIVVAKKDNRVINRKIIL